MVVNRHASTMTDLTVASAEEVTKPLEDPVLVSIHRRRSFEDCLKLCRTVL